MPPIYGAGDTGRMRVLPVEDEQPLDKCDITVTGAGYRIAP
jgi:hypothetical protein